MSDMDDINESPGTVEQPGSSGRVDRALRTGLDRRTMLKAAVATGTIAATWIAPRIETLGFAPAAAAGTPCIILSRQTDDTNQNNGGQDCPIPTPTKPCCGSSWGDAGKVETFTFNNPVANCTQIVVRTVTLDCDTGNKNPDVGQTGLIIQSASGAGCSNCRILDGVIISASGRQVLQSLNNATIQCPSGPFALVGSGIDASVACNNPLLVSSSRFAVRLTCNLVTGHCVPNAT
jgi:hypothetical protein